MYQGIKKFSTSFSSFCGMLPEVFFLEVPVAIVTLYPGWWLRGIWSSVVGALVPQASAPGFNFQRLLSCLCLRRQDSPNQL